MRSTEGGVIGWGGKVLLVVLGILGASGAQASRMHLEANVEAALAARGEVRVMVLLEGASEQITDEAAPRHAVDTWLAAVPELAGRIERRFENLAGFSARIDAATLAAMRERGGALRVSLDEGGRGALAESIPLAEVAPVHLAGLTGAGNKVVILDSGLRLDHQSFAGRIVDEACFCQGCCPNGQDTQLGSGAARDDHGHGTNVGGIAVGGEGVAGVPRGVASGADIVAVRVLDQYNGFCCSSDIIAAYDWVLTHHPDATVINASLGTNDRFAGNCDTQVAYTQGFAAVLNQLRAAGVLATVSSGNNGSSVDMQAPACIASTVAVAAVYDADVGSHSFGSVCTASTTQADQVACFSNLSPTTDLLAPGAPVTAAGRASASATSTFSGTSMAAPMVAGCIALLKEAVPSATPDAIEAALKSSPVRVMRGTMVQDYPRLDCAGALQRLLMGPVLFSDGFESWE